MPKDGIYLAETPYASIQGEGIHVGERMLFIRTQGCVVDCKWCDSRYTWPSGEYGKYAKDPTPLSTIIQLIKESTIPIWWTGGEPLYHIRQILEVAKATEGTETYICTSGFGDIERLIFSSGIKIVYDLKAPSSGVEINEYFLNRFISEVDNAHEVKMVLNESDLEWAAEIIKRIPNSIPITIQPEYSLVADRYNELRHGTYADFAKIHLKLCTMTKRNIRYGMQLHKVIWPGIQRGI